MVKGAESVFLLSKREDDTELTCMLVNIPAGSQVEEHTHECDEIIYVLKGKAKLSVDGVGIVDMKTGSFFRIPRGLKHRPFDIEESLEVWNVFYPYLV